MAADTMWILATHYLVHTNANHNPDPIPNPKPYLSPCPMCQHTVRIPHLVGNEILNKTVYFGKRYLCD